MQAVIFDLDNCLCPADAVGRALYEAAFDAIRAANDGRVAPAALDAALEACWHTAFDLVARQYGFSETMTRAGDAAFRQVEVHGPLQSYADLALVKELPLRRYLVTTGYRRLQESKIRALGIAPWFEQVLVDAIDEPGHPGKKMAFQQIAQRDGFAPHDVMVVGDNPVSDLAAGRALGMVTVQLLRPGVLPADDVDHRFAGLREVLVLAGVSS